MGVPVVTNDPGSRAPRRTLVVTGHFPPSHGGVQRFTAEIAGRMPAGQVVIAAIGGPGEPGLRPDPGPGSGWPGHPVHQLRGPWYVHPGLGRELARLARDHGCEAAWITSAMPFGALAPQLRRAGIDRLAISTHGMEVGWSKVMPARAAMRAISRSADVVTYLGEFTRPHVRRVVAPGVPLRRLHGGVDVDRFHPAVSSEAVRRSLGLQDRRVVVTVSRLVPRKGQDMLLRAWPMVLRRHPDAVLLVVGHGRHRHALEQLAAELGVTRQVRFTGSVSDDLLAEHLAAAEVFALPCRTVWHGLQPEGLGLTTLEASATGLPVVVGDSGGAPEAVLDGETGLVVDGASVPALAEALETLLDDPALAHRLGSAGRRWMEQRWTWDNMTLDLTRMLDDPLAQAA